MNKPVENGLVPRIGAQFFINPDDTPGDVEKHFEIMQKHGIRIVRLFILWEHVEPNQGEWDFGKYDIVYDTAHKYGVQIASTLTAEDPPQWLEVKPFYHHYTDLNNKDYLKLAAKYIKATVERYHKHKAHYSWILMNEPELFVNQSKFTMAEFQKWLLDKYGDVQSLNQKWYRQYKSFDEVQVNPNDAKEYWQCFSAFVDWQCFLKDNLVCQLTWIKEQVQLIDKTSVLHLNPKGFFGNLSTVGQDYWKENEVSDILGASIHPAWKFLWFSREDYGVAFAFCVDIIRSASNGKSFWVTELQSGATLMTGIQPCTPSPEELSAWVLDAVGAGAKAVLYWMWHPRSFGQEAGEWGIVTNNHKISKRLLASAHVSRIFEDNAELFSNAVTEAPHVCILYNHATEILSLIEGSELYRTPENPIKSLVGVYKALLRAHIAVDFVSQQQILQGDLSRYEVAYLPYSYAIDLPVQKKISDYVQAGGKLWAEVPCAWKNSYGEILRNPPLENVFGTQINEFCGCQLKADAPYFCHADLDIKTAKVTSLFDDGSPAIIKNSFGKGEAMLINSTASLGYFETSNATFASQIADFAKNTVTSDVCVEANGTQLTDGATTDGSSVIRRLMKSDKKRILILENWGNNTECLVKSTDSYKFKRAVNLYNQASPVVTNGTFIITLRKNETAVIVLS